MSRPVKLAAGALLLTIFGVLCCFAPQDRLREAWHIPAVFGGLGFSLFFLGLRPGLRFEEEPYIKMKFLPSALLIGLCLSAAGVGVLFLFYRVIHFMPRVVWIAAALSVPLGLIAAGACWGEACKRCDVSLLPAARPSPAASFDYCPKCQELAVMEEAGAQRRIKVGSEARSMIASLGEKGGEGKPGGRTAGGG